MNTRQCTNCNQAKPISEFKVTKHRRWRGSGLSHCFESVSLYCLSCDDSTKQFHTKITDGYARQTLKANGIINPEPELIELQKQLLKLKRNIKLHENI